MKSIEFIEPQELFLLGLAFLSTLATFWFSCSGVNRQARVAAFWVMLASLSLLALDFLGRQSQARQDIKTTKEVVGQIQRVLGRFDYAVASFKLRIPTARPELEAYGRFLDQGPGCLSSLKVVADCLPSSQRFPDAFRMLSSVSLRLEIAKNSASGDNYQVWGGEGYGDLALRIDSDLEDLRLEYQKGDLVVRRLGMKANVEDWRTGKIVATDDLVGARLFVSVEPIGFVDAMQKDIKIESISLRFIGAPECVLDLSARRLAEGVDSNGLRYYVYQITDC